MSSIKQHLLYVDSDPEFCDMIRNVFVHTSREFKCSFASSGQQALEFIGKRSPFDLLIMEYCLFDMTGALLCRKIRELDDTAPVLIHTALYRDVNRENAMNAGANAFILKSDGISNLFSVIRRLTSPSLPTHNNYRVRRSSSVI